MSGTDQGYEIICLRCGAHNERGTTFCAKCGAFLEWEGRAVEPIGAAEVPPAHARTASSRASEPDAATAAQAAAPVDDSGHQVEPPPLVAKEAISLTGYPPVGAEPVAAPAAPGPIFAGRQPSSSPPETYSATPARVRRRPGDDSTAANAKTCGHCGETNVRNRRFCRHCGNPLPADPWVPPSSSGASGMSWWQRLRHHFMRRKAATPSAPEGGTAAAAQDGGKPAGPAAPTKDASGAKVPSPPKVPSAPKAPSEPKVPAAPKAPQLAVPGTNRAGGSTGPGPQLAAVPSGSRLGKPTRLSMPKPKLLNTRGLALLVCIAVILAFGGEQVARYGLKAEYTRVRSFFYPHYSAIALAQPGLESGQGSCRGVQSLPAGDMTTTYWYSPPVSPSGGQNDLDGKPWVQVQLSQGSLSRIGITPMTAEDAATPRQLDIDVDGDYKQVTLADPPTFQSFSVNDGDLVGDGNVQVQIWLLSTVGSGPSNTCALTGFTFYAKD